MLTDNRVPDGDDVDDDLDQLDDDLASAALAAAALTEADEITARTHRVTRDLLRKLGGDAGRLRRCVRACRRQAERTADNDARTVWRRAERLAWNALTLVEALDAGESAAPA
jgi:cob(I)alamin adenosyltransferase